MGEREWLEKVPVEAGVDRLRARPLVTPTRHGDDLRVAGFGLCAKAAGDFESIRIGHAEVEQDQIWPELARNLDCFVAVVGAPSSVTEHLDEIRQCLGDVVNVVDDQHTPVLFQPMRCHVERTAYAQ